MQFNRLRSVTLSLSLLLLISVNVQGQYLTYKPVPCLSPTSVVVKPEDVVVPFQLEELNTSKAAIVVVTYDIATMYKGGQYNGTFAWGEIDYALNSMGRYWNIRYQRVTRGGQFHIVQSNYDLGKDVAARTGSDTCRISPTFRFVVPAQSMMLIFHENRHTRSQAHHAQDGGLMGPMGGYLLLNSDLGYFDRMTWKSSLRPSQEPDWLKRYFLKQSTLSTLEDNEMNFPLIKPYK